MIYDAESMRRYGCAVELAALTLLKQCIEEVRDGRLPEYQLAKVWAHRLHLAVVDLERTL